jgi:predicted metal-binding membrane protein
MIVGACWAGTVWLAMDGGHGVAHDPVLGGSTWPSPARLAAFAAVWLLMVGAMMLPTVTPLTRMFEVVSARAPRPRAARAGLYAGYLAVWAAFAPLALLGSAGVHALVGAWAGLAARPELVLAATLIVAGAYQFSPLKDACLTACRNPMGFLWQHYRRGPRAAWLLGARHGLSCLGCCWALMLVMFATGVGSLAWMLALTGVMVIEKASRYGPRLVAPVGIALLVAGAVVAVPALTRGQGMVEHLAHAGHDHGPAPGGVALLVALAVLAVMLAASALVRRMRS